MPVVLQSSIPRKSRAGQQSVGSLVPAQGLADPAAPAAQAVLMRPTSGSVTSSFVCTPTDLRLDRAHDLKSTDRQAAHGTGGKPSPTTASATTSHYWLKARDRVRSGGEALRPRQGLRLRLDLEDLLRRRGHPRDRRVSPGARQGVVVADFDREIKLRPSASASPHRWRLARRQGARAGLRQPVAQRVGSCRRSISRV